MSVVVCKLPKAGLGNQLFPLMKAYAFAELNKLPIIIVGYNRIKFGPYLRREKNKRNYRGFFRFEKSLPLHILDRLHILVLKSTFKMVLEPDLLVQNDASRKIFYFNVVPHWSNYFGGINTQSFLIRKLFKDIINPLVIAKAEAFVRPVIGVHIRMGDFKKLIDGQDFGQVGLVRTPIDYFCKVISKIRQIHHEEIPVAIFSDGYPNEISNLLNLNKVSLVQGNSDIIDLFLLSRSKIIVCSAGSSFSYWAGFLSSSPMILHPDHIHAKIRIDGNLFEGSIEDYEHFSSKQL